MWCGRVFTALLRVFALVSLHTILFGILQRSPGVLKVSLGIGCVSAGKILQFADFWLWTFGNLEGLFSNGANYQGHPMTIYFKTT